MSVALTVMNTEGPFSMDERSTEGTSESMPSLSLHEFTHTVSGSAIPKARSGNVSAGMNTLRANLAVMSILRSEGLQVAGSMEIVALRARWGRYALRARDLESSLQNLSALGLIDLGTLRGRQHVILTEAGHRWIHSFMGFVESLMTWPRRILHRLSKLGRPLTPTDQRRRSGDRNGAPPTLRW